MNRKSVVLLMALALVLGGSAAWAAPPTPVTITQVPNQQVLEGNTLTFTVTATTDNKQGSNYYNLGFSTGNLPAGATLTVNPQSGGTRTATFTWTPGFNQAGTYRNVTITATDYNPTNGNPKDSASTIFAITVGNVNQPPELKAIGPKSVDEGQLLSFTISASDPDVGDTLTFAATHPGGLPSGASFDPATRTFTWTPSFEQAGNYKVTFTVTDNGTTNGTPDPKSDSEEVTITVGNVNRPPVLTPIGSQSVNENQTLSFPVTATDPDGVYDPDTNPYGNRLTYSVSGLPPGATFENQTFTWTPTYEQSGNYTVTFTVTDNGIPSLNDFEEVTITVNNVNRAPKLDPIGDRTVDEGQTLSFTVTATDPDQDQLTYKAENLPEGAEFNPSTRVFTWTPGYDQAGTYEVKFTVTDNGTTAGAPDPLSDSETIKIIVGNVNRAPVFNDIPDQEGKEGEKLEFQVLAVDPDGDPLTYSASNLPEGATFDPATRTFSWTPTYDQAGSYQNVTFSVTDGDLGVSKSITITIGNVNRPPKLNPIGAKSVKEGQTLTFTVAGSDADGDALTFSADGDGAGGPLPDGASFDPDTKTFTWTPGYDQAGSYEVYFYVTDNGSPIMVDQEKVIITVGNTNRAPVFTAPGGNINAEVGKLCTFTVNATDPDNDPLVFYAKDLPSGATFDGATFSWTPVYGQAGQYTVTFIADDGMDTGETSVVIAVSQASFSQLINDLVKFVLAQNLAKNIENSYIANLKKVDGFVANGQKTPALNQLNAFVHKVNQDLKAKIIPEALGAEFIRRAKELINILKNS